MEGKLVRSAVVICLVLGLLLGTQSNTGFVDCYKGWYISCLFRTHHPIDRAEVCIKPCLPSPPVTPPPPPGKSSGQTKDIQTPLYFCKLGCATTLCANISTVETLVINTLSFSLSLSLIMFAYQVLTTRKMLILSCCECGLCMWSFGQ